LCGIDAANGWLQVTRDIYYGRFLFTTVSFRMSKFFASFATKPVEHISLLKRLTGASGPQSDSPIKATNRTLSPGELARGYRFNQGVTGTWPGFCDL
jgi:hypothetical protein